MAVDTSAFRDRPGTPTHIHYQAMLHHGFGDFLMAVPVIKALDTAPGSATIVVRDHVIADFGRGVFPDAEITWVVRGRGIASWMARAARLRAERPTAFLGVHAQGRRSGWLARCTGAPLRVGPIARYGYNVGIMDRDSFGLESVYDERRHKVDLYMEFLRPLGLYREPRPEDVRVAAPTAARSAVERRFPFLAKGRIIGIAPSCGLGKHKMWSSEGFAGVIARLAESFDDVTFVLVGGPTDRPEARGVIERLPPNLVDERVHDLTGETSLTELLAVAERMSLLVTICNGPSHVAAAAGVPVVGIYGPTNPGFTGAYTPALYVVRKGFSCSPCYRSAFEEGCGEPRCMSDIEQGAVVASSLAALQGDPPPPVPALENTGATRFTP